MHEMTQLYRCFPIISPVPLAFSSNPFEVFLLYFSRTVTFLPPIFRTHAWNACINHEIMSSRTYKIPSFWAMHQFSGGTPFGSVTGLRAMFSNVICSAVTATVLLLAAAPPSCWSYGIAGQIPKWWQNTIIYEIYPQSFYDSDNDGFGDLRGKFFSVDN